MSNNMKYDLIYNMTQSGNCPVCKTKIKFVDIEGTMYKAKPVKIYHDKSKVEAKCPVCKRILVDR